MTGEIGTGRKARCAGRELSTAKERQALQWKRQGGEATHRAALEPEGLDVVTFSEMCQFMLLGLCVGTWCLLTASSAVAPKIFASGTVLPLL